MCVNCTTLLQYNLPNDNIKTSAQIQQLLDFYTLEAYSRHITPPSLVLPLYRHTLYLASKIASNGERGLCRN